MGWSVSYQLRRATPLDATELVLLAEHTTRYAAHPWPTEPYAATATRDGTVVARGCTKMPWSTTAPAWRWLLAALSELRTLIPGATCEVADDHDAITWSDAERRYAVVAISIAPRASATAGARPPRRPAGTVSWRVVRVDAHQRHGNVIIRDEDRVWFGVTGASARLEATLTVRTAIASQLSHATARFLDADGRELAAPERARWGAFVLPESMAAQIAHVELVAGTITPCEGHPVARLACGATAHDGHVALAKIDGWPRYPRGVMDLRLRRGPAGLAVECDGRDEALLMQRDLELDFIVFDGGGAELSRATTRGGLADHHFVEIPLPAPRLDDVRRLDVRVTGTLVQTARVGRWRLTPPRPRAADAGTTRRR